VLCAGGAASADGTQTTVPAAAARNRQRSADNAGGKTWHRRSFPGADFAAARVGVGFDFDLARNRAAMTVYNDPDFGAEAILTMYHPQSVAGSARCSCTGPQCLFCDATGTHSSLLIALRTEINCA
jgi:hypothetical protein